MKTILIMLVFFMSFQAQASRLIEIEDYYSNKTSEFIKSRYPRKAFSVYVKVEAENTPQLRQPAQANANLLNLPYLDQISAQDVSFWDRKDVSLGTLISYLRSVFVKVDIDQSFSNEEMELLKTELFQYLKLSEAYDRIEIKERKWAGVGSWQQLQPYALFGFFGIIAVAVAFFFIFQTGVSRLVKGLSQPLSEIGRSAENVANSSQMTTEPSKAFHLPQQSWQESNLSSDQSNKAKEEIKRLSPFLSQPDAELLHKIEELGERDPYAMGAIFSEMSVSDLKKLIVWSKGAWWRTALTEMTPLSSQAIQYLNELSHLYIRSHLLEKKDDPELAQLKRLLARLSKKQYGQLLEKKKFDEVKDILRLLPQEMMLEVAKYLYPGQWAELLESHGQHSLKPKLINDIEKKAIELCPLKTEAEIATYFKEADLLALLDRSTTKDEREIYRALPDSSWIKKDRMPFYQLFLEDKALLEALATDLPLELWALSLVDCDREETEKLYEFFTSRQRFVMRNFKSRFQGSKPSEQARVQAKKRILTSFKQLQVKSQNTQQESQSNEVAA